jgi:hypothetical protein
MKTSKHSSILSRNLMTMDGVWIGNRIYWTLTELVITLYKSLCHKVHQFSVTVITALLGNIFQ